MNFFNKAKTLTLLACSAGVAFAAPTIEVGTWGNFCKGAVSHTFDDYPQECKNLVTTGRSLFNDAKLPMTLFVIVNKCDNNAWNSLKTMAAEGHEVGSHGNHADGDKNFTTKSTIEQNIPGYKCVSWAFPYCTDVQGTLSYYVAARDCDGSPNPKTPTDFNNIEAQMFDDAQQYGAKKGVTELNSLADKAAAQNGWSVYLHHGLDGSHSMSTNSNDLKSHLSYLNQKRSTIWCETFGNVALYIKERDAAKVTVTSSDDKSIKLTVTDNLENSTYNYPLSLRTELPSGWTNPTVTQNSKVMKDTVITDGSKKYLMFQAIPDAGEIVITGDATSIKEQIKLFETGKMVLIDNNKLSVNSHQFSGSNINVSLFNLNGKVIAKYTLNNSEANIALPSKKISNETYFVKVSDGRKTYTEKVTPQL